MTEKEKDQIEKAVVDVLRTSSLGMGVCQEVLENVAKKVTDLIVQRNIDQWGPKGTGGS